MFPHPQTLITVRAMEREQLLAQAERERRFIPRPATPGRTSVLRRAARVIASLAG